MHSWKVTWFDGNYLRETIVEADVWNIVNSCNGAGVWNVSAIIKIEKLGPVL